jgi:thiol-disulfide isomerase/thioredoxin
MPTTTDPNRLLFMPVLALLLFAAADAPRTAEAAGPRSFSMHPTPRSLPPVAFQDGAGKQVPLSSFKGKVVVLNLWATWCAPCRREMPTLDRLQAQLGGPKFQVVALSADAGGPDAVRGFFQHIGVRHLAVYVDPSMEALSRLKAPVLPTTLLLDESGREIGRLTGPTEWDDPAMVRFLRGMIEPARDDRTVGTALPVVAAAGR